MTHPPHPRTPPAARWAVSVLLGLALLMGCAPEASREGEGGETPQSPDSSRTVAGAEKLADCPSTPSRPPVSDGLPDVSLPCLGNGPDIRLADLRGPLLVNVWAQWCGPCRDEAPYLADLQQKSGGKVQLIGIDYADPRPEKAIEFAVEHGLVYPHLADTDKQVRQPLRVGGPPLTAFVDKAGKVVHVHRGVFKSQQELDQLVRTKLGVTW